MKKRKLYAVYDSEDNYVCVKIGSSDECANFLSITTNCLISRATKLRRRQFKTSHPHTRYNIEVIGYDDEL